MSKMNREERRKFTEAMKQYGITEEATKAYFKAMNAPASIQSGDKVMLDVKKITSRKGFAKMNPNYQKFVEGNRGAIFTARVYKNSLIEFEEEPTWLFIDQDLIKVEEV